MGVAGSMEAQVTDPISRRTQQRFEALLPVEIVHAGKTHQATSRNLSLGGMFISMPEGLPFGAAVTLHFRLPALPDPVTVDGNVRWVQAGVGIGVQFGALRARAVWALQQLFASCPPAP
jgi:hypothetical protein